MFVDHAINWLLDASWTAWENKTELFSFSWQLLVFAIALLLVVFLQWIHYMCTLPPGPWGLPYFGWLFRLSKSPLHLSLNKLASQYGRIFSCKMANQYLVGISDYALIRDSFRKEAFSARPHTEFTKILGDYGIINAEGEFWKEQRRFIIEKLRLFGNSSLDRNTMLQQAIYKEVDFFIDYLESKRNRPISLGLPLGVSISNIICGVLMSVRFNYRDPQGRFKRFMNLIDEGFQLFGAMHYINYIPQLRYMSTMRSAMTKLNGNREEMAVFFQKTIDNHRKTVKADKPRDLLDTYLLEIMRLEEEDKQIFRGLDVDRHLQQILADLFTAGMETVKTTMEWAVVLMLHYPEAAKVVQDELDAVIGRDGTPRLADMKRLPKTQATILEIMRRTSVVPLGTTHATTKEVNLGGYTIPKGAQIVPLLQSIHMNEKLWTDPEEFRPERFLVDGKIKKPEYFMPFGVGRRMCLGDVLARNELFIFFTRILHTYNLELPKNASLPSLDGNAGVTVTPDPFKVILIKRDEHQPAQRKHHQRQRSSQRQQQDSSC